MGAHRPERLWRLRALRRRIGAAILPREWCRALHPVRRASGRGRDFEPYLRDDLGWCGGHLLRHAVDQEALRRSVYYIDQHLRDDLLAAQILGCRSHIYANPREAIAKADQARRIFEAKFSAEVLLGNAIAYHEQVQHDRRSTITRMQCADTPVISVIIRCLGRSSGLMRRAVQSVLGQSVGRFELVFVSRGPIDPIELSSIESPRVIETRVIEVAGDSRSNLLWAGLRAASGDYICVLDETDYLFSDHFERMLTLCSGSAAAGFLATRAAFSSSPHRG